MKKNRKTLNENEITEILASTGYVFPRNKVELERFEILFGENDYGLTGNEVDPNIILERNQRKPKVIKLSDVENFISDDYKLVARKDEDICKTDVEKLIKKPNPKR